MLASPGERSIDAHPADTPRCLAPGTSASALALLAPFLMLAVIAAPAAGAGEPSVTALVERLLAAKDTAPTLPQSNPAAPYTQERTFQFDDLDGIRVETLLQGLAYLSTKYPSPEDESALPAYRQAMVERYELLLEYYPVMARDLQDFYLLLGIVEDGSNPPLLREFLIRRSVPGIVAKSALGDYLHGMLAGDVEYDKKLAEIIKNPTEFPAVQLAAIAALDASMASYYADLLDSDPLLREHVRRGNPVPGIQQVKETPDSVPLTRRTQQLIQLRGEPNWRIGKMLSAVAMDPGRSGSLREAAGALAATIGRNYPIPNGEVLQETSQQPAPIQQPQITE